MAGWELGLGRVVTRQDMLIEEDQLPPFICFCMGRQAKRLEVLL